MTVAEKLDKHKTSLLLLTGSNPAINIRKYKAKGLELRSESAADLLFHLLNEKILKIKSLKTDPEHQAEQKEAIAEPSANTALKLYYDKGDLNELNKRAQKTQEETILFQEEQGVNILFLALGYLKWKEDDNADKEWTSPLVLIPVKIGNDGSKKLQKNEQWSVTYNEEEIEPNHSLQESLIKQYGIRLPEMPDWSEFEDLALLKTAWQDWVIKIKKAIAPQKNWEINDDQVLLSFFSFSKYQMYKDLDSEKWCSPENPNGPELIRKLLEDDNGFYGEKYYYPDTIQFDKEFPAEEPFTVMDLNSSQAEVLMEAKHTQCLVVEGPPGTGKSTTITNIIADAINDGKKVLFVAEKMAALEVVKDNLSKVNLGKFCLELHGNKTSKIVFVEDFKRILDSKTDASLSMPFSKEKLNEAKNELRKWSDLINNPLPKNGYSPYELYGLLMWSKSMLGETELPSLQSLITNFTAFQHYATTVTKANLGYKQAGKTNGFVFESESEAIKKFQQNLSSIGKPELHPFYGSELATRPSDSELAEIKNAATSCIKPLEALAELFTRLQTSFPWLNNFSSADVSKMIQVLNIALQAPDERVFALTGKPWIENEPAIRASVATIEKAQKIKTTYNNLLIESVWSAAILNTRIILATTKNNWFNRIFNSKYKAARKHILGYFINPQHGKEADLLQVSDDILSFQESGKLLNKDKLGEQIFGPLWQGINSHTELINNTIAWGLLVQGKIKSGHLPDGIISFLSAQTNRETIRRQYEALSDANNSFGKQFTLLREKIKLNPVIAEQWKEEHFETLKLRISNMAAQSGLLADWVLFYIKSQELKESGKNWIVQIAYNWEEANTKLLYYVLFKVWEELVKIATAENPALDRMQRIELDSLREKFITQDNLLKQHNQLTLIEQHNTAVKTFGNIGQPGFVRDNIRRKRKIPTIRKFLSEAFDAITSIKPVFMMSPLSVASYLEAKPGLFDMVIFDEASQIEPIDAFGAILRAKQVIVVGDTKQMPPSSFFKKMTDEDIEDEDNEDIADAESIMDLMVSRKAKRKYFLWHYRSKHQSLIRVSNTKFYDEKLLIYPSKETDTEAIGLKLHQLSFRECPYEGGGVNTGEAKVVAQAMFRFSKERAHKTLGVVAFNIKQKETIQKEVEQLAKNDQEFYAFINKEDKEGKKINFIKNLENVQGDERDVIFISIGYGMSDKGTPSYNFGPLNKIGGERRLNVLITRAKEQNVVFCNFSGNDLDPSRTKNEGVKILCQFLNYAATGIINTDEPLDLDADSVFEEQVLEEIKNMGYNAKTQVGSKGYRIDIAITHPEKPGRFILAIECDGARYHSSVSARDRDRLRQDILEKGGWKFYRIWSSNWFRSRGQEIQKLKTAITEAIQFANEENIPGINEIAKEHTSDAVISIADHILLKEEKRNDSLPGFPPYIVTTLTGSVKPKSIYDLKGAILERYLLKIIQVESPVHMEQVYARIFDFQNAKATEKAKKHILQHLDNVVDAKNAIRKGEFIWTTNNHILVSPRNYADLPDKDISIIAPEELDQAFITILKNSVGATTTELLNETSRCLGFRKTESVLEELNAHLSTMLNRNLITAHEGILQLS